MAVTYLYGMRLRGFSIGCQPMDGLVERLDDKSGLYHDILVYDRKLTQKELDDYELDWIVKPSESGKVCRKREQDYECTFCQMYWNCDILSGISQSQVITM